jgi:UDP:flavonoid glycosyltransferase YjiC (YdhE family)
VELFPHVDAVLTHAGQNTVSEALAHELPLVVAPTMADQPFVAEHLVGAGAAVRVSFRRARPAEIRRAVREVLADGRYREAARRLRGSFEAAGGAPAAVDALEELVAG